VTEAATDAKAVAEAVVHYLEKAPGGHALEHFHILKHGLSGLIFATGNPLEHPGNGP
jgi:hypothetical protein